MRVSISGHLMVAILVVGSFACGGPTSEPATAKAAGSASPADAGAEGRDAGMKEPERPFAGSTGEATSLISEVVDKRHREIAACVRSYRGRMNMRGERIAISFGIDQEGKLLGVTSKGKEDAELKTCVLDALKSALFPRSHSGVITVTKTYEELVL